MARIIPCVRSRTRWGPASGTAIRRSTTCSTCSCRWPPARSSMFISREQLNDFYQEEGETALKVAREALQSAGVVFHAKVAVGEVATTIARYAKEQEVSLITMGTRGMGSAAQPRPGLCRRQGDPLGRGAGASDQVRLETLPQPAGPAPGSILRGNGGSNSACADASSGMTRANSVAHQQGVSCP